MEKNKRNNIFLILNATQYYNSLEAKHYFCDNVFDYNILIIDVHNTTTLKQIKNVLNKSEWDKVYLLYFKVFLLIIELNFLGNSYISLLHYYLKKRKLEKILSFFNPIQYMVVSNLFGIIIPHAIFISKAKANFLLDDGVGTIDIVNKRFHNKILEVNLTEKSKKIYYKWLKFKNNTTTNKYLIFTSFNFNLKLPNDKIIKNNYKYIKEKINVKKNKFKTNEVFFLGSPFIGSGCIMEYKYLEILEKIKLHYEPYEVIYIVHKNEQERHLKGIKKILKVRRLELPVELYISKTDNIPHIVSAFASSGLFFIKALFGSKILVESIELEEKILNLNSITMERHRTIESYIKNYSNIPIVHL